MSNKPTYNDLLKEIEQLKQQLEAQQKLKNEQELSQAWEKAEKSERLFRRLIENAPWGMHFYKLENDSLIFTGANRAADKLLHMNNSQFAGKTIEEAFPPLVQTEIPFRYREAAEKGLLWTTEQISYEDNKITGAFEVIAFQTSRGNMVAAFNDITERKQHEEQLKEKNEEYQQLNKELIQANSELVYAKQCLEKSEERFRLILKNSNDTLILVNKNGEQFYISDAVERDTGFTIDELKGPIQNVIYPPDLDMVMQVWEKLLNSKNEVVRVQYRHKHKHKEYIWYEAAAQNHLDNPAINAVVVNIRDITAIKETEAKLIKAKELAEASELKVKHQAEEIENFFNCAIDLLCIATTDGYFERLNQEWNNVLGYALEELEGKRFLDFVHPDDVDATLQVISQLAGNSNILNFTNRYRCKNGSYKWIEWRSYPYGNKIYAAARDITERKRFEEELFLQKTFIEAIFNSVPGMLYLYDEDGQIVRWNRKHEAMTGYTSEEMSRMRLLDWFRDDEKSQKAVLDGVKTTMESGFGEAEANLQKKDGTQIPMYFTASPLVLFEKHYFAGIGIDITERKRVEEELIKSELLMRTAIENLPIIFYMLDNDGFFKLSIGAGLQSLGLQPNQVVGISAFELYKDHPHIIESVQKALSGEMTTFESNVKGAIHFNIVTPISISNESNGIVGVALDITERKQIELEAILAKEKAEENDRLKTAFLQNMSHEIRTPMNAIIGFASLMAENCSNKEKLEQFSEIIEQRSYDLLAIINDMLDISKIESGQGTLQLEEYNINELFSELALFFADYQKRTDKQHIQLLIHPVLDEDIANMITDQHKLKQILINLITNAFKFTESGRIECGCKLSNNQLLFHVSDTGVGIPVDKHEFIFDRFTRIETVISKSYVGGTGLGLPIVKGLVDLLGGKVWIESECNKGSTFYFTINYEKVDRTNAPVNSPAIATQRFTSGKSILIVEDDQNNALYLEELIRNYFSIVYVVGTGLDAIKLVNKQSVDLVLMDVRLPDITGYDATKTILQNFPGLKIIAQTAYASNDEHLRALDAGCVDYISKPTSREQLLSVISRYL
ncbi:MAG: PAS domain S-box protein [Bacteroidales bacterium]|nr:PAS domain S-box protein [Bacteroidales bacterium]